MNFPEANAEPLIYLTIRGIMIDRTDENENARDSIRANRESLWNVMNESKLQDEKQSEPSTSTRHGISIDSRDELKNAKDSMCLSRRFVEESNN
jgi:hypothetical protein